MPHYSPTIRVCVSERDRERYKGTKDLLQTTQYQMSNTYALKKVLS